MSENPPLAVSAVDLRTCKICLQKFDPAVNNPRSCRRHPESFSGETAQRWLPPGVTEGGGVVHYFYTCCGKEQDSPGCCYSPHRTFDEPDDVSFRKPGMGIDD
mmetsp:Transcript_302/g.277  ORF Transcript_302/g.277 Transcript_302/m.277 type:complete len:103 (+) Transcript_302:81-389(+)